MPVHSAMTNNERVKFPPQCACCMGPAQVSQTLTASLTTQGSNQDVQWTGKWQVPYCKKCTGHINSTGGPVALGCVSGLLIAGVFVLIKDYSTMEYLDWGIAVGLLFGSYALTKLALTPLMVVKPGPRCGGQDDIVTCDIKGMGLFYWYFKNAEYGKLFEKLNA